MKIYWLMGPVWGIPGHKCFFKMTREEAQEQVDFRRNMENYKWSPSMQKRMEKEKDLWYIEEEDVPDEKFGWCLNDRQLTLAEQPQCSVGMVRNSREGVSGWDCGSCVNHLKEIPKLSEGENFCALREGRRGYKVIIVTDAFEKGRKAPDRPDREPRFGHHESAKNYAKEYAGKLGGEVLFAIPGSGLRYIFISEEEYDRLGESEWDKS